MQWGWILCHRALYTWRKHKAAQARTISVDSELSWSGCISPRHTNSWIFRGAHLLLQSLRWEMGFRHFISPFFYYYIWKLKGQTKVLNSARVLHKQLLLQRDLFLPEQQHLDMSAHPHPHPGYFHLQVFYQGHHLRPNHTTAITPPPRLLLLFCDQAQSWFDCHCSDLQIHLAPWPGASPSCSEVLWPRAQAEGWSCTENPPYFPSF